MTSLLSMEQKLLHRYTSFNIPLGNKPPIAICAAACLFLPLILLWMLHWEDSTKLDLRLRGVTKVPDYSAWYKEVSSAINVIATTLLSSVPRVYVELGSWVGTSARSVADTLKRLEGSNVASRDRRFVVICVDTWLGGPYMWNMWKGKFMDERGRRLIYDTFLKNIQAAGHGDVVVPFPVSSTSGLRFLQMHREKLGPEVVYLDTAHIKGEVYVELKAAHDTLKSGGFLTGHDYHWIPAVKEDVRLFATEFSEHYRQMDAGEMNDRLRENEHWKSLPRNARCHFKQATPNILTMGVSFFMLKK